jgi:hypothetical protein
VQTKLKVSAQDITQLIADVRKAVEINPPDDCPPLLQFVYWPQEGDGSEDVLELLNETRDMIERSVWLC